MCTTANVSVRDGRQPISSSGISMHIYIAFSHDRCVSQCKVCIPAARRRRILVTHLMQTRVLRTIQLYSNLTIRIGSCTFVGLYTTVRLLPLHMNFSTGRIRLVYPLAVSLKQGVSTGRIAVAADVSRLHPVLRLHDLPVGTLEQWLTKMIELQHCPTTFKHPS